MLTFERAIPILRMDDPAIAEAYYCGQLGFARLSLYFADPVGREPAYLTLGRDEVRLHLSSFEANRPASAYLEVNDVDTLFAELTGRGATCHLPPTDQTWGRREIALRDPFGNTLTFASKPARVS